VLNALVQYSEKLPPDFVLNLLQVRLVLAPEYTREAVINSPEQVFEYLANCIYLNERNDEYASFDWQLHYLLTIASGNPIFTLILNGFAGFYEQMACIYFDHADTREASKEYYCSLSQAVKNNDSSTAEKITRIMMTESIKLWESHSGESP
jgi:GntR family negative regulator for fad regulon and positive regulator of fabA